MMKLLIVSVIIVLAVAGGLLIGGVVSNGFFTGFSTSGSSTDAASEDGVQSNPASPSFNVKVGKRSSGSTIASDGTNDDSAEDIANDTVETGIPSNVTVILASVGTGGGSNSNKPADDSEEDDPPVVIVQKTKLEVSPSSVSAGVNDTFTVSVAIDAKEKVYAASLKLVYDKSVISAVSADEGDFFKKDGSETYKIIKIDDEAGKVSYDNTRFSVAEGVDGKGTILTVEFIAVSAGTSSISISEADVLGDTMDHVDYESDGGTVNVQ